MFKNKTLFGFFSLFLLMLTGCATQSQQMRSANLVDDTVSTNLPDYHGQAPYSSNFNEQRYAASMPSRIETKEKVIVVDPAKLAWGAYDVNGELVKGGMATMGADFCEDEGKPCRTTVGTFRIFRMGGEECVSKTYPIGQGGSLMPYCMFFNNGQSLHGSPDGMFVAANISHGCVHLRIPDAEWLRYNFASNGTKVIILPYAD